MGDSILKVAAQWLIAKEHPSEEARDQYLKEHPKANPAKHTVKKSPESDKADDNPKLETKVPAEEGSKKAPKPEKKPEPKEPKVKEEKPSEGAKGLKGILKVDSAEIDRIAADNKEVFDKVTAEYSKAAENFKSEHYSSQMESEKQNPGLFVDTRDLLAAKWDKMSPAEKVIHVAGHKIGENFEKTLSSSEMKMQDRYFEQWRTTGGSYDSEGNGQAEDYDHSSQELQGLMASLGVNGSQSPDDVEADQNSKGGVEKARKKGAKDAKLTAYVKKLYDYQQAYFKSQGLKELTLYRGVKGDDIEEAPEGTEVSVQSRELSSFTADPNIAKTFGRAIEFKVPVERIFASSLVRPGIGSETYDGSFNEAEFIVMGASDLPGSIVSKKGKRAAEKKTLAVPVSAENEAWLQSMRPKTPKKPRLTEAKILRALSR